MAASSKSPEREKSKDAAGVTYFISVIKMIDIRGVEIDSFFNQPQAQDPTIEVNIFLWVTRNCGNVMYTRN